MATFSSLGVGSGLDAESLVSQLMKVERQPITLLDSKESATKAKLSAYGTLRSSIDALKSAADTLSEANKLSAFKTTLGDASIVTATTSGTTSAGTYSINVIRLATSEKRISATNFSGHNEIVGAGTLGITVGGTTTNISLTSATATLSDVKDAINASNAGVTANIITGDSGTKLVLSAKNSGEPVSITATDDNLGDAKDFARLSSFNLVGSAAQTAQVEIDGVLVTSNSNTVSSAIGGITFTLTKLGTTSLTVARDPSTIKTAVENFVKAYNDLQTQAKSLTQYDTNTKTASTLTGDSLVRNVQSQLYEAVSQPLSGLTGVFSRLSDLGISIQSGGKLALDSNKLQKAIDKDFDSVVSVLTGYGGALETKAQQMTTAGGILAGKTESLNGIIKDIGLRRTALEQRMEMIEKRYRAQFTSLDTLIGSMKTTSNYLSQQLANLST
ncbi:flagellar filament capping protein FliD [Azonexus sp. IMCC34839]|uniref:flagellar filament capping protein FliD n=1 Tax=Azonexus sp. IMCC34839 TaxID=3133695 RepID=UPI00399A62B6